MASIDQATDVSIVINTLLEGKVPEGLTHVKYIVYNKSGVVITKQLGDGVIYANGKITITLSDTDTANLAGTYTQECIARTTDGVDYFPLKSKPLTITKTTARIS